MSSQQPDIETLLRMALRPVEPPDTLAEKLEGDLQRIVDLSSDELDSWQADALHDPRTWVKPAAAVAAGTLAAGAVAILGVSSRRRRAQPKGADPVRFLGEAATTISREIQRRTRG
ncbi:MAG: hypothetical protein KGR19_09475 [Acidobacteria bacterium]|nr:hypothetical protein [Acidobacteriota bacterium]